MPARTSASLRRGARVVATVGCSLALAAGLSTASAVAAPQSTTIPQSTATAAQPGDAQIRSAGGCTTRNGPGDFNQNCIDVTGDGLYVDGIKGSMLSSTDSAPVQICGVQVHVTGMLTGGVPYDQTGTAQCGTGAAWVDFDPNTEFVPNSQVCSQTLFDGEWSNPACIEIYA